jgi:hypothetical protein
MRVSEVPSTSGLVRSHMLGYETRVSRLPKSRTCVIDRICKGTTESLIPPGHVLMRNGSLWFEGPKVIVYGTRSKPRHRAHHSPVSRHLQTRGSRRYPTTYNPARSSYTLAGPDLARQWYVVDIPPPFRQSRDIGHNETRSSHDHGIFHPFYVGELVPNRLTSIVGIVSPCRINRFVMSY